MGNKTELKWLWTSGKQSPEPPEDSLPMDSKIKLETDDALPSVLASSLYSQVGDGRSVIEKLVKTEGNDSRSPITDLANFSQLMAIFLLGIKIQTRTMHTVGRPEGHQLGPIILAILRITTWSTSIHSADQLNSKNSSQVTIPSPLCQPPSSNLKTIRRT